MSVTVATTWYPRGELERFSRYLPVLKETYTRIVVCFIPSGDASIQEQFTSGRFATDEQVVFCLNDQRRNGRYLALKAALDTPAEYIHYVDMDRLLRWVETRPEEWREMVDRLQKADATIFGRSEAAMRSHPQALISTEVLSNRVVSHYLGAEMDVSAGSKAFSRQAARFVVANGNPEDAIGTDAEWPMLMKKGGFSMQYILVEGLDYESADQFRQQAATPEEQQAAAVEYDRDPAHWSTRADIADRIIKAALEVASRTVEQADEDDGFDLKAVFDVDDYLYFYRESLTDERTEAEVSALVSLLELERPMKILDLACGFGRHTNRLASLGHALTGIDLTPGFLEVARREAKERGLEVTYRQADMRTLDYEDEFERVMLLFTAFGYFSDEVNQQILASIGKALKPGGLMIFDTANRDALLKNMRQCFVVEKEGNLMIDRFSFDGLSGRWYNRRMVIRNGMRKDKPFFVRLYNPNEVKELLKQAGLELYHLYAGLDGKEYTTEAHRMVVVARRPVKVD